MPELPEVETVARGLQKTILGRKILSVALGKTDFIDDPAALEQHLPGRRIEAVERYGKFMMLRLSLAESSAASHGLAGDDPASLLVHLGMTGNLVSKAASEPHEKHTHVWMLLDDGRELRYTDPRRFGRMAYLAGDAIPQELKRFGADPLLVSVSEFVTQFASRRSRIKSLLLDQSVLRGVGNIYADESLWRAKIHPAKVGASLSKAQKSRRCAACCKKSCKKRSCCAGPPSRTFRMATASRANIRNIIAPTDAKAIKCYRCAALIPADDRGWAAVAIIARSASWRRETARRWRCRRRNALVRR